MKSVRRVFLSCSNSKCQEQKRMSRFKYSTCWFRSKQKLITQDHIIYLLVSLALDCDWSFSPLTMAQTLILSVRSLMVFSIILLGDPRSSIFLLMAPSFWSFLVITSSKFGKMSPKSELKIQYWCTLKINNYHAKQTKANFFV